ncbi:MAG TPA: hypothetical protein VHA56_13895 [Mucilaginibacter sp.]|nr:hypothetical protein [Mucilaginibacter sp.]
MAKKTENKAIKILAKCLSYLDELHNLKMTAEDAFDARQAENNLRRIIKGGGCKGKEIFTMNSFSVTKIDLYVLVLWPDVQDLMAYAWFRTECILYQAFSEQRHFDSAYFVPLQRIIQMEIT